jgi:hypothetical protein
MWQSYIYEIHWSCQGKMYYDEIPAESKDEAREFFIDHKRDDVNLLRVVYVRPNEGGVREPSHSPYFPFNPLIARRNPETDEDVR